MRVNEEDEGRFLRPDSIGDWNLSANIYEALIYKSPNKPPEFLIAPQCEVPSYDLLSRDLEPFDQHLKPDPTFLAPPDNIFFTKSPSQSLSPLPLLPPPLPPSSPSTSSPVTASVTPVQNTPTPPLPLPPPPTLSLAPASVRFASSAPPAATACASAPASLPLAPPIANAPTTATATATISVAENSIAIPSLAASL
ncbi:Protein of unknown function [Gryllus bimaculatus]|nr:Protein of unknown function [Gryllus bimaculatus]